MDDNTLPIVVYIVMFILAYYFRFSGGCLGALIFWGGNMALVFFAPPMPHRETWYEALFIAIGFFIWMSFSIILGEWVATYFNSDSKNETSNDDMSVNEQAISNLSNQKKEYKLPTYMQNGIQPYIPKSMDINIQKDNIVTNRYSSNEEIFEDKLKKMDWRQFELFLSKLFNENGYETVVTAGQNDEGKDIIAKKDGITYFIECKHYVSGTLVGREQLQKLGGAALPYNVKHLIFITLSGYNSNATEYARKINDNGEYSFSLLETNDIIALAKNVGMV